MELKVLEESEDKVKLEIDDLTFVNLLNEALWDQKIEWSAWARDHPYLAKPIISIKAKDPKKALIGAAEDIQADAEAIKKAFVKAAKD